MEPPLHCARAACRALRARGSLCLWLLAGLQATMLASLQALRGAGELSGAEAVQLTYLEARAASEVKRKEWEDHQVTADQRTSSGAAPTVGNCAGAEGCPRCAHQEPQHFSCVRLTSLRAFDLIACV